MTAPSLFEQAVWYAALALQAVLLWRMLRLRLAGTYPAIFALIALQLLRSAWISQYVFSQEAFLRNVDRYGFTILFTEPVLIAARAAAVFELTGGVLHAYRGLRILSRGALLATLLAGLAVSLALHSSEFDFSNEPAFWLRVLYLAETTVYSALLVFLLLLALFVLYHPAPIRRNLLAHGIGFTFYMVSSAAAVWLRNQDAAQWTRTASTLRLAFSLAGLALWAWLLSPRGEEESVAVHVPLSEETGQRVLARLAALNSAIERK
ncbi:MAG: hypothetical protein N2036_12785 [Bryobacteraceae bacterium]|nr:hypothetical protein [Bryobacteraceae bacterium]MCX7604945.1 hypothetical protein [Bryobacteraceae bacterium]